MTMNFILSSASPGIENLVQAVCLDRRRGGVYPILALIAVSELADDKPCPYYGLPLSGACPIPKYRYS